MEPLTALSLASSVLQIVSFSHETITVAKRIARDGFPDANLADNIAQLSGLSQALEDELLLQQGTKPLTKHQQRLREVAQKCLKSSNYLKEELDKVKWKPGLGGGGSKTENWVFSQTWKFLWAKSKIERLQREMREVEQTMQSSILTDLWLAKEAASIQQEASFGDLDDRLQWFISQYTQGNRKLSELVIAQVTTIKDEVSMENTRTRDQIAAQLQWHVSTRSVQEQCDRLLGSLAYDAMTARRSRVAKSHEETSHWIFDSTIARPWASFLEWLKSDDQIYWISGKPGSGKSTLMKFLVDDHRTRDTLLERGPSATIVSFFLWNSGTPMQRSVQGLLSAVLHQILSINRELIPTLLAEQPELLRKINYSQWSDEELESVLIRSISAIPQPLCIFLDGLDEIDRDEGCLSIVDLIERLQSNTTAKFCVSSRPQVEFKDAFRGYPTLRLQDLTAKDISNVVKDFLQKNFQFRATDGDEAAQRQELIDTILERAGGVFLWVHLVLKSLRRGNVNIDSYEQLSERIARIPEKLEELYKETWGRHGEDESLYRVEAARYFKLVLEARNIDEEGPVGTLFSLFEFAVASNDAIQTAVLEGKSLPSVESLVEETERFCRRIESRCGGFLEVSSYDPSPSEQDFNSHVDVASKSLFHQFIIPVSAYVDLESGRAENLPQGGSLAALWNAAYHGRLDFIHRTAADFLLNTNWGRAIIDSDPATSANIRGSMFRSQLVRALLFTFPPYHSGGFYSTDRGLPEYLEELRHLFRDPQDKLRQNLLVQLEDVYERLFDRIHTIDYIITQLRLQIRNRQFDASYYKIMCDLSSYRVKSLQGLYIDKSYTFCDSDSRLVEGVNAIGEACLQILANHTLNAADLSHNVNWPAGVPKLPILRRAVSSSDDLLGLIFADVFSIIWVLRDARNYLQKEIANNITEFLWTASRAGMRDTLKRCIGKRANVYVRSKIFKEVLLFAASLGPWYRTQRNDETVCWLLGEGADVNWRLAPGPCGGQLLTPFEWFLLSVPFTVKICSTDTPVGRIVATIRAYISAGANLDRVICLTREAYTPDTWREFMPNRFEYAASGLGIITELNVCQLIQDTMAFMEDRLAGQDPDIRGKLGNISVAGCKGYRKVLCVVSATLPSKLAFYYAATSPDDSDLIFQLLDSETVSDEWAGELQSLVWRILETGEEVRDIGVWLSKRGHSFNRPTVGGSEISFDEAKPFYEALFPDLAHDEGPGSEK